MFGSVASRLSCAPRNLFRRYDENQLKVTAELLRAKGSEPVIEPASLLVSDWSQEDYLVMHLHRVGTALRPIAARPAEIPPAGEPQDPRTLRATSSTRNGITPSPPECRPEAVILQRRLTRSPEFARAVRTAVAQNLGDETERAEAGERCRLRRTRRKGSRCAAAFGALAPRPLRGRR